MILGIGTDIVKTTRFEKWSVNDDLLLRYLHEDELEAMTNRNNIESIAGRFAAKEAFVKALGTGFRGLRLRDIRVLKDAMGKPVLELHGVAEQRMTKLGAVFTHLSISHDSGVAIALVVLESYNE